MNRRQKIIVSITGIFIVLLALVGLTYAYFLTRITGNSNDKSISVTTAKLELVYGDDSAEIIKGTGALMPTEGTDADDAIGTKTFTVTNNGNDSSYVVIIDNVETKYASNGSYKDENGNTITYTKDQETNFVTNDFRYTLTCSVKDKNGNIKTSEKCNDVNSLSVFPINGGILVGNAIPENRVHEYTLTLWYIDNGENQSNDMNKTYQARVNIEDINRMENPFKTGVEATDKANLAYNILENAKTNKNGTRLVNTPPSKVAEERSTNNWDLGAEEKVYYEKKFVYGYSESEGALWSCYDLGEDCSGVTDYTSCTSEVENNYVLIEDVDFVYGGMNVIYVDKCENGKIVSGTAKYEKVLATTPDDYGTSYYYRGAVEDNYVNFAGMCWRIVRIAGDGSVKLILEDQYTICNDMTDNDGDGTTDYKYIGDWNIGTGNYGYELRKVNSDSWDSETYDLTVMNYLRPAENATSSMVKAFYDFQTTKLADYTGKLKSGDWCLGDKAYTLSGTYPNYNYILLEEYNYSLNMLYDSFTRLTSGEEGYSPTFKCNGTVLEKFAKVSGVSEETPMYVSTITADEIVYAGGSFNYINVRYYLINSFGHEGFWTISANQFDGYDDMAFCVGYNGLLGNGCGVHNDLLMRPSVILKSGTMILDGEGTIDNPYVIG